MTTSFAVNANNDLYIGNNGSLAIVSDIQSVLVACACIAKSVRGEMFLQVDRGIPYFETVFTGSPQILQFEAALRAAWKKVDQVLNIISLTTSVQNNQLSYAAEILTSFGAGTLNG